MTILFYPEKPKRFLLWENKVRRYCRIKDIKMIDDPSQNYDAIMFWSYDRFIWERDDTYYELLDYGMINYGCYDVTKTHNEEAMLVTFGYNTIINSDYEGVILKKANWQCAHEMVQVEELGKNTKEYIYVKQVDNRVNDKEVLDYRIFVFDFTIPLVVTKIKPVDARYSGAADARMKAYVDYRDVLSADEGRKIIDYCTYYGSHITELDAVRDSDGKLYILDNNNIAGLSKAFNRMMVEENLWDYLAEYFYESIERHII